jgi:hypothetical protein
MFERPKVCPKCKFYLDWSEDNKGVAPSTETTPLMPEDTSYPKGGSSR